MKKKLLYLIPLIFAVSACKHIDDLFTSYGPDTTESRQVGEFTAIEAGEKFDIFLICDTAKAGTVEMTAGSHVIKGYTSKVENGVLKIRNENKFNWVRKLQVRQQVKVYFKTLEKLQINGSAKFTSVNTIPSPHEFNVHHGGLEDADIKVNGDYVYVNCTNTGGVNISGTCFLMSATVDDISFVNSAGLDADKCYLSSFSRDNSTIFGRSELGIKLYGVGDVFYKDTSTLSAVSIEVSGEGKVHKY